MLYIHCGLHKTGSTAIQNTLQRDHRPEVSYDHSGYRNLGRQTIDKKWVSDIVKYAAQNNLILSSEGTLGGMANVYGDVEERVNSIKSLFSGIDYMLIVYFRPHLSWLESVYTQLIQQGESLSPADFFHDIAGCPYLNFTLLAELLTDTFGQHRLMLRSYPGGSSAVEDFYSVLNIDPPQGYVLRANYSLSPARLSIMRELNKSSSQQESRHFRRLLQREIIRLPKAEKLSPFPEYIQISIQHKFSNDWDSLLPYLKNKRNEDNQEQTRPFMFIGDSVNNPRVMQEALHIIRQFALHQRPIDVKPALLHQVIRKLKSDPLGLVQSIARTFRRRIVIQ